ncbi:MAG: hypothetical protein VB997_09960 [Opitutales bacterium]
MTTGICLIISTVNWASTWLKGYEFLPRPGRVLNVVTGISR